LATGYHPRLVGHWETYDAGWSDVCEQWVRDDQVLGVRRAVRKPGLEVVRACGVAGRGYRMTELG